MRFNMPCISIAYAQTSALGHRVLAENYAVTFSMAGYKTRLLDVLPHGGYIARIGTRAYNGLVGNLPALWRGAYHMSDNSIARAVRLSILPRLFHSACETLLESDPDIIVTTHPLASAIVEWAIRKHHFRGRWVTAFSDWHYHPFWTFPSVSKYFVTSDDQRDEMLRAGVSAERVVVTGLLLGAEYYRADREPPAGGTEKTSGKMPMVVVMSGGAGWKLERVLQVLLEVEANIRFVVIAGSKERETALRKYLGTARANVSARVQVVGFVDPLPLLRNADLVLSKPGALTTAQVIALGKRLALIVPMPGHEEANATYLQKWIGCSVVALEELADSLPRILKTRPRVEPKLSSDQTPSIILESVHGLLHG
jgi:processive 1,2-diacylglycerol beta-glucosyltransferase